MKASGHLHDLAVLSSRRVPFVSLNGMRRGPQSRHTRFGEAKTFPSPGIDRRFSGFQPKFLSRAQTLAQSRGFRSPILSIKYLAIFFLFTAGST